MTYGSSAYGSASYGGSAALDFQTFFILHEPLVIGVQSRVYNYPGSALSYAVHVHMPAFAASPIRQVKLYTHNDPSESPQLQATIGESFESETIIGTAEFITVEIESSENLSSGGMYITGREVT